MSGGRLEAALRQAVMGTRLEASARFVWKRLLRRKSQNDVYDLQTDAIMQRTLRPESNCVDIGCHAGAILDAMLRFAPNGRHHAFEPLPHLAAALRDKYAATATVTLHEMALSNARGVVQFHVNHDHPGMSGINRRDYLGEHDRVELIRVATDRLDAIVPAGLKIDFVKVDVEGAESLVFEGARECLRRHRPIVVFEHGEPSKVSYGAGPEVVFDLLAGCGLRVSRLDDFIRGSQPLTRTALADDVESGRHFYFVAHP